MGKIPYDVKECKWLNVLAKQYGDYLYIFCSCRDINSRYSMEDTWGKFGKAKGLKAKKIEVTRKCIFSTNQDARIVNMKDFETVCNFECANEDECKKLHRMFNVIFKRFYVNDFGGPRIKNFPIDKIEFTLQKIVEKLRKPELQNSELLHFLGKFDKQFREKSSIKQGQIYVIDNKTTIKVGASYDAQHRFDELKSKHEINEDAKLKTIYDVYDQDGFETSAHCALNYYKDQNPAKSAFRDKAWGGLDEHFANITPDKATEIIDLYLSDHFIKKEDIE